LVNLKVNVFSFQTDSFAPQKAILSINEKLISATLTHHIFRDETLSFKANHLNWAKYAQEIIPKIHQNISKA